MSKLGISAALLSAVWLIAAAANSGASDEATMVDSDELQGMEIEHLQNGAGPSAWGHILEMHATSVQESFEGADVE